MRYIAFNFYSIIKIHTVIGPYDIVDTQFSLYHHNSQVFCALSTHTLKTEKH